MTPFRIAPAALAELEEAAAFYNEQREGFGLDLFTEFQARLQGALEQFESGSPAGETPSGDPIRRFRLDRFARYAIVLATIDGMPTVLAFELPEARVLADVSIDFHAHSLVMSEASASSAA